ncbi:hypothetical protein [Amnibacterium kyonggiense]|uniref:Uncharacterized protein n=1 Tax=Amnibacterium kyonggiense TaxID=595671 RepID=A0A4R7FLL4_9MICO|nr:hypothetical protein [Amnibacterium kyonggiense]TDS77277.1 hypothetical protein CLV52_2220 [Amnibacterium kyonggiense]
MPELRRPHARRRARFAAIVTLVCALVGAVGVATGAEAAPALRSATAAPAAGVTQYRLGALAFDGGGNRTTSTVGNGGRLVLTGSFSVRWTGERAKPRLTLQRRIGSGRWTTTTATVSVTDHGLVVRTPAFSTKATKRTVAYRLRSAPYSTAAGTVSGSSVSRVVHVVVENQRRYTGLAKSIWTTVRPYCPATAVHVGSLASKAGDFSTGALLLRIDGAVRGYRPIDVRAVALHECSHERQWLNYGGTSAGWQRMEAAAATRFADWTAPADTATPYPLESPDARITPVEHAADCGAQAVNPGGYLGYGGYCTAAELAAGKRLLHGHRY